MAICNTTLEDSVIAEDPLWKGFTFHHFGLFLAAIFGLISVIISLWLIYMHATHYLRPSEQKNIIRILFMIPVYSIVSFLSYLFYKHAVYYEVLRDCYEAFAISSFFALLCFYVAPDLHSQKEFFRTIQPKNWFLSVFWLQKCTGGENKGPFRKPRSGLTWFNVIWAGIFQYCFVRVFFTIVSVISEALGRYCEASLSPAFAHIWVLAFECISVTVAMFMVIQFYIQLKDDLSEHKPFLKVLSIKLVIFFSFWQTIIISLLSSANGPLQPTKHLAYQDIKIGIPSVLLCIEMACFSVLHVFAYPWKPYSIKHMKNPIMAPDMGSIHGDGPQYKGGFMGTKAIVDAFNPWDIIKSIARGFRWMFVGVRQRHNDPSYHPAKLSVDNTGYTGPSYAATGDAATELRPSYENRPNRGRAGTLGTDSPYDDHAGLLGNSQALGRMPTSSPYRHQGPDDYAGDLGPPAHPTRAQHRQQDSLNLDMKPSEWDDEDTGYHPGMAPAPGISTGPSGNLHPTSRGHSPQPPGWNHWGGVDSNSLGRPPTYSNNDPRS
ncbi:hypothetical protein DOTSEDRAFT_71499 [Dothistroma septosporum NZE10]|uniref:DUF300-domain-containing protein n=1 Tax=Dothistroma septosporum (strain NZE10 / CBS 128990) TaxID=675120 RepID=N1PQU6_DOTSN|nr:hypothetical protein DOTSEDRAFT_71499 [Dothistroma septosporum NZE10]